MSELQVGAKVQIESRDHPTAPAADFMVRLHGRTGTIIVPGHGGQYAMAFEPRLVDLDGDRRTVLVAPEYLDELEPAPTPTDPAALLLDRAESYQRDAGVIRQAGRPAEAVAYETIAAELRRVAEEVGR